MTPEDHQPPTTTPIDPLTIGELITLGEAAKFCDLTQGYLKDIARRGRLRAKKSGHYWLTTQAALEDYLKTKHRGKRTDLAK